MLSTYFLYTLKFNLVVLQGISANKYTKIKKKAKASNREGLKSWEKYR